MLRKPKVVAVLAAVVLVLAVAQPATATGDSHRHRVEMTSGEFHTLPGGAGLGFDVDGAAVMLRIGDRTFVRVHVRGLDGNLTYPAHVHNAPCSGTPAGGSHYQHEAGIGPDFVNDVNEIWPVVTTNPTGRGHGSAWHGHRARTDAMSVVIHYPPDTSVRLACADLA